MNLVCIIGNLARDPEVRYGANGLAIAKFTVAVNRPTRGDEDEGADFIRVTTFGKQAESAEKYLAKGRKVAVEGRIQTGSYENKEGQKVYTTEVIASRVEFLTPKPSQDDFHEGRPYGEEARDGGRPQWKEEAPSGFAEMDEDDMPF